MTATDVQKILNLKHAWEFILDKDVLSYGTNYDILWGKAEATNQRIAASASQVVAALAKHQEKLFVISDGFRSGLHPLTPSIRSQWFWNRSSIRRKNSLRKIRMPSNLCQLWIW